MMMTVVFLFVGPVTMIGQSATANCTHKSYHILFIGNSLTMTNDLPTLVEAYAQDKGIDLKSTMLAKANYAIVDHWADADVQREIESNSYDFVVLQQGPSSQSDGYEMLVNDGKAFANLCAKYNSQLAYFMVWPASYHLHTFDGVIANYTAGAKANEAILCPVGKAWKAYIDRTNDLSYYGADGFHPSMKGSQVAAAIIVESLFEKRKKSKP